MCGLITARLLKTTEQTLDRKVKSHWVEINLKLQYVRRGWITDDNPSLLVILPGSLYLLTSGTLLWTIPCQHPQLEAITPAPKSFSRLHANLQRWTLRCSAGQSSVGDTTILYNKEGKSWSKGGCITRAFSILNPHTWLEKLVMKIGLSQFWNPLNQNTHLCLLWDRWFFPTLWYELTVAADRDLAWLCISG